MKVSYAMFDLTNRCNFNCKHCYKGSPELLTDLNYSLIIDFVNKLDSTGQIVNVILSGGEPLMYSSLYDLLDSLCGKRHIRLNTNAYFLDKHIDKLSKYDSLEVQVSLDGYDEDSFWQIRNNRFFSKILENSCLAKQSGINLFFRSTLTRNTILNFEHFIELSKKTGIPLILRPMIYTGEEYQKPLAIDYSTLQTWHNECKDKGLQDYVGEYIVSPHCPILQKDPVFSTLTIDAFGNIYPCMLLKSNKFLLGNIIKNSFDEIISNSESIKINIENIISHHQCKKCGFRKQFGDGTCVISCFLKDENCIREHLQ